MSTTTSTSTTIAKLNVTKVTASSYESGTTNVPSNVNDGNLSTRWSAFGKGQWVELQLDGQYSVSQIKIAWYDGNARKSNFSISVSNDGSTFASAFTGQSSGTTSSLETYTIGQSICTYVKITVNGNTSNDWASISEAQVLGTKSTSTSTTTPTPTPTSSPTPSPTPSTGLDENGVKEIYPTSSTGIHYVYQMSDNIESGKYVYTDSNYSATQMTEGGITFKRLTAGTVTYSSTGATGRTCRINVNAGGFLSVQTHTWQNESGYIWTSLDSKNSEFTYYFRVENYKYDHTSCSTKMHGGIHTSSNDPRASCIEMCFFIGGSSPTKCEAAYEYSHPNYVFESVTQNSPNNSKAGQWIGRKTVVWTGADGKVHSEDWVDWAPFDSTGKPVNNWVKLMSKTFGGTSTNGYTKVPNWGGMNTIRIDGYATIDISILSIREITPPS